MSGSGGAFNVSAGRGSGTPTGVYPTLQMVGGDGGNSTSASISNTGGAGGDLTFVASAGGTGASGNGVAGSIIFKTSATTRETISTTGHNIVDNYKYFYGTGNDMSIYYDGTNGYINPKEVGSGQLIVLGDLNVNGKKIITSSTTNIGLGQSSAFGGGGTIPIITGYGDFMGSPLTGYLRIDSAITIYGADQYASPSISLDNGTTSATISMDGATGNLMLSPQAKLQSQQVYSTTVGATNRDVYIDNSGFLGYVSSSAKTKKNIRDYNASSWIYDLTPRVYDRNDVNGEVGLIAEEVEKVNPALVSYKSIETNVCDANGNCELVYMDDKNVPETVSYSKLVIPLLTEIQNLNTKINEQGETISVMKAELCRINNDSYSWCQ